MAGFAEIHSAGKRGGKGRARAELEAQRRAQAWLARRRERPRTTSKAHLLDALTAAQRGP